MNIIEIFASIQGETSYSGLPTTFIRLAACNLRCSWCDTPYSFGRGTPWTLEAILDKVKENGLRHVCVTGGEPLLQKEVHVLLSHLCDAGYIVTLETGGSLSTQDVDPRVVVILDIKCPGSGMSDKNHWPNLLLLRAFDEVKFVLLDRQDYSYAKEVCDHHNLWSLGCQILLSPVHGQLDAQELVGWVVQDRLPVRLNLQIHKYIWTPETQGV